MPMVSQQRILTPKNSVGEPSLLLGGSVVVPCIRGFCAMVKIRQTHRHDAVVSLLGEVGRLDSLECRGGQEQCARYTVECILYTALDTGLKHSPKAVSVS